MKQLAILGNTPALSALELDRLGALAHWPGGRIAELTDTAVSSELMQRLGGTIKIVEVLGEIPRSLEGIDILKEQIPLVAPGKVQFGYSVYPADSEVTDQVATHYAKKLKRIGIDWKKELRSTGQQIRYVESQEAALSSVIVRKEHLLDHKTDFVFAVYKKKIVLGRTLTVQDYHAFSKRDYGRPERDHASGMLPPKVARMMVNIAVGSINVSTKETTHQPVILDPFCGSGTVVQEALDIGFTNVIGSDHSKKCIEDSATNLASMNFPAVPLHEVEVQSIHTVLEPASVDCVVAEGFLGPTRPKKIDKVVRQSQKLYEETLAELPRILRPGARVVLAIPAWPRFDRMISLELDSVAEQNGFTKFHEPILYGRPGAQVVREIHFLTYQ